MNKTIWAIVIVIIMVAGGWLLYAYGGAPAQPATTATNTTQTTSASDYHDNIYLSSTDAVKGSYMTDFAGKTLYTFDNDTTPGQSSCNGTCAVNWPPYTSGATAQGTLPAGLSVIDRPDGMKQYAWQGKPLYYYAKDTAPGQLKGDGIGGIWHIVKM